MNTRLTFAIRYWKPISIGILMTVLCLIPASELSKINVNMNFADLVVHFTMFMVFSAFLFFDLDKYNPGQNKWNSPLIIALTICILLAVTTETLQYFLILLRRSGNFVDLLFDFIGSIAGIAIVKIIKRISDFGF